MSDDYPYRYEPGPYPGGYQYPTYPGRYGPPAMPAPPRRQNGLVGLLAVVIVLLAAALTVGGIALANTNSSTNGSGSILGQAPGNSGNGSGGSATTIPPGQAKTSGVASDAQQTGIVTIVSTLKYQNAQSAGTGMILTSDGEVLTNNHVIRGATSIVVTVESTGKSYRAGVVGTAPASDVAVLQLRNASGLKTANVADDADEVRVGDTVIGVGNAGGTGTLTAAGGKVTALNRSITASDETGQDSEKLTGLIQVNAKIISGDSGGPLYDDQGEIVGINTAASTKQAVNPTAYAIPIDHAVQLADKIETGVETTAIHIGYPAFLGVSIQNSTGRNGAVVAGLLDGGPAAEAGVTEGSIITAIDGKPITSADALRTDLTTRDPGTKVKVVWTDRSGDSHTSTMTLGTGPAD